jgi:predicted transcriptional regulator
MEYVGNEGNLEEASKIKELKNDPEFLEILSRKFQDTVLNAFGFKQQHNIPLSNSHTILNER